MVMPLIHCCLHDSILVHFVHFPFAWNYDRIGYEHDVICIHRGSSIYASVTSLALVVE